MSYQYQHCCDYSILHRIKDFDAPERPKISRREFLFGMREWISCEGTDIVSWGFQVKRAYKRELSFMVSQCQRSFWLTKCRIYNHFLNTKTVAT